MRLITVGSDSRLVVEPDSAYSVVDAQKRGVDISRGLLH